MIKRVGYLVAAVILVMAFVISVARAADEFYKGKTIRLIVAFSGGG